MSKTQDAAIEPPVSQPQSAEEQHRAAERCFWDRQIGVAKWLNRITFVAALVGLVGLVGVAISIKDARDATAIANEASIAPRNIQIDWSHTSKDGIAFKVMYENIGRVVAENVTFGRVVGTLPHPPTPYMADIPKNDSCYRNIVRTAPVWPLPKVQLKDELPADAHIFFQRDKPFLQAFPYALHQNITLYVEGCFTYDTFHDTHQTAFCRYLKSLPVTDEKTGKQSLDYQWYVCPDPTLSFVRTISR